MTIPALLIGHGRFPAGLANALQLIVGDVGDVEVVTSDSRAREEIEQLVRDFLGRTGNRPSLVFTDIQGGCSSQVCSSLLRDRTDVGIISGVNLPMLIKYVHHREQATLPELYRLLLQAGSEGIKGLKEPA
jgi:mannose PTS system EIIA component